MSRYASLLAPCVLFFAAAALSACPPGASPGARGKEQPPAGKSPMQKPFPGAMSPEARKTANEVPKIYGVGSQKPEGRPVKASQAQVGIMPNGKP